MQLPRALRGSVAAASTFSPELLEKMMSGGWQGRAYGYYDSLGEIHYAANFHARIGKLRWYVGQRQPDGTVVEREDLAPLLDDLGDMNALAETYGRQRFLGGEQYAMERMDADVVTWECVSPLELRRQDQQVTLLGRPSSERTVYDRKPREEALANGDCHLYRLWRPHPRNSYMADCSMQAVLTDCERLRMIRAKDISETRSRIPAGILIYPKRAFPPGPTDKPGETPQSLRKLQEALVKPVNDVGDPNAQVPFMVGVDGLPADKPQEMFRHLLLDRRGSDLADDAREEKCVTAIARGLDMPVEYLTGVSAINHWGQWFIEDQLWKSHLQPLAQEFGGDFTEVYLSDLTNDDSIVIWYDEVGIVAQPDKGKDALLLFDRGGLTWERMVEANGFTDADIPTPEQRAEIKAFVGGSTPLAPGSSTSNTSGGEDQTPPGDPGGGGGGGAASASGLAAYRAMEVAGNRLVNLIRRSNPLLLAELEDVPRHKIPTVIGRERAAELTGALRPERILLKDAASTYAAFLERQGYDPALVAIEVQGLLDRVGASLFNGGSHNGSP